jgi:hypothetical protein
MSKVSWKSEPDEHDHPAATAYLSLIADGCHRVCASYHIDENTDIPCHIVGRVERN